MEEMILEVSHLRKEFPQFVLDDISFCLPKGCIMGLIGENGAGKTTALKLILGLLHKDGGTVSLFGKKTDREADIPKSRLGVVFSDMSMPQSFHAVEIGKIFKNLYPGWDEQEYSRLLKKFELDPRKTIKEFSRGMRMKLNLILAMSHHAELLLLDEATSGLDPVVRDDILDLLLEFVQDEQHAVLISSHITSDLEKAADYITYLHEGKVLLAEEKDRLLEDYAVLKGPREELSALPPGVVRRWRQNAFGAEALVRKSDIAGKLPQDLLMERTDLDSIMVFYAKGEKP